MAKVHYPCGRTGERRMAARLHDTYVAALRHDLADVPEEATLVGVVRRPTRWFSAAVDENRPELGPPSDLLDEFKRRHEEMKMQGLCDEGAHNAAWDEVSFETRYRTYLAESDDAREAVDALSGRLRGGEALALVCYENTDKKRCHRTVLRDHLASLLAEVPDE